jgi:hypothetical protein
MKILKLNTGDVRIAIPNYCARPLHKDKTGYSLYNELNNLCSIFKDEITTDDLIKFLIRSVNVLSDLQNDSSDDNLVLYFWVTLEDKDD